MARKITAEQRANIERICQRFGKAMADNGTPVDYVRFTSEDGSNVAVVKDRELTEAMAAQDYERKARETNDPDLKAGYMAKARALREGEDEAPRRPIRITGRW